MSSPPSEVITVYSVIPRMGKLLENGLSVVSVAAATTATAVLLAKLYLTAAVQRKADRSRRLDNIRRSGTISAQTADKLRGLCLLVGGNKGVLCALRSRELKTLVFGSQSGNLVLSEEIKNCTGVVVLAFQNISGVGVHGIADVAQTFSNVEVYTVDGSLSLAAAVGQLMRNAVNTALEIVAQRAQGVVYTVEACGDGVVECVGAIGDAVGLLIQFAYKGLLIDSRSYICLSSTGMAAATATGVAFATTIAAVAAEAPAATTGKEEKQDNPPAVVAAKSTVVVFVSGHCRKIGRTHHSVFVHKIVLP